jgi:hypothetical protein
MNCGSTEFCKLNSFVVSLFFSVCFSHDDIEGDVNTEVGAGATSGKSQRPNARVTVDSNALHRAEISS